MILYSSRSVITVVTYRKNRYTVHVAGMVIRNIHSGVLVKKEARNKLENLY
jgi:hypothetical protein